MALSADRNTPQRDGKTFNAPVAADVVIYGGALVALDASGNLTPGAEAATLKGAGRACGHVSNDGGSAGDVRADYEKGTFRYKNSASTDEITRADIGNNCYIVDDETVAKTDDESARSVAGVIADVDDQGVWVRFD